VGYWISERITSRAIRVRQRAAAHGHVGPITLTRL
jgi:hypothetical protein